MSKFQESVRDALGAEYETFLQGSYKNDTSIKDINDVDIVALRKGTVSGVFSAEHFENPVSWGQIFKDATARLEAVEKFKGKTSIGDKCIKVNGTWNADVVPAVRIAKYTEDPIAIYSFGTRSEKKNYPRLHYENGVAKQKATSETYKAVVRMFKKWVTNQWPNGGVAPSFYVECLIYRVPDDRFSSDLALAFFRVGYWIESNVKPTALPVVLSVAGDKDILVQSEWNSSDYAQFHAKHCASTTLVARALKATTQTEATRLWRAAFNE